MPTTSLRVFYIRHGQSVWNADQNAAKAAGKTASEVRRLGDEPRFTDAPLTAQGVRQALSLSERLFDDKVAKLAGGELSRAVRCSRRRDCPPPLLFTSNLRRAIDTALLGLGPLLEDLAAEPVIALPALQETCHYTDCEPLPLSAEGIEPPDPNAVRYASKRDDVLAQQVTGLQRARVEHEHLAYLYKRLHLAAHTTYDDRRRLSKTSTLSGVAGLEQTARQRSLERLTSRLGDIATAIFEHAARVASLSQHSDSKSTTAVITAHSRLLRELLFMFRVGGLTAPVHAPATRGVVGTALEWDSVSNAAECAALADEGSRISNCGVVAFDLVLHSCDGASAACQPKLTLRNCIVDEGTRIDVRTSDPVIELRRHGRMGLNVSPAAGTAIGLAVLFFGILFSLHRRGKVGRAARGVRDGGGKEA